MTKLKLKEEMIYYLFIYRVYMDFTSDKKDPNLFKPSDEKDGGKHFSFIEA